MKANMGSHTSETGRVRLEDPAVDERTGFRDDNLGLGHMGATQQPRMAHQYAQLLYIGGQFG